MLFPTCFRIQAALGIFLSTDKAALPPKRLLGKILPYFFFPVLKNSFNDAFINNKIYYLLCGGKGVCWFFVVVDER